MSHKSCFRASLAVLVLLTLAALPASAAFALSGALPTAWTFNSKAVDQVETLALPELDREWLATDDIRRDEGELPPRFAVPIKVDVTPETHGVWEDAGAGTQVWRYRIKAVDAYSLNLGFSRYRMPEGGRLLLYSPDGGEQRGPFTAEDNETHGELWTPVLLTDDLVVEITVAEALRPKLELRLTWIGHGYRGFGAPGEKSGACNMDVECIDANDTWRATAKASAVISTGGSTFCSGSLLNNTAEDKKPVFMTANHCGINSGNAASLVTYWNYRNSTCRTPGSPASGGAGDGSLAEFNTGSFFRAANAPSDFTLVELDDPINPAFDLYWAGWDRTPYQAPGGPGNGDHACAATPDPNDPPSAGLCAGIHHPSTDEMRITFSETTTATTSYNVPSPPGDGTHVWVHWDSSPPYYASPPGVTEPGSSGSPLYNADHRFIGQLHGGPSACGATGDNLSDYYGRLSVSWNGGGTAATRASDWLDPLNTGVLTLDGRGECAPPAAPANPTATANGANRIDVAWDAVAGAEVYRVFRSAGACPGGAWTLRADNVVTTSYSDLTVLGGVTYAYRVTAVDTGQPCESAPSACDDATATGSCPLPDPSAPTAPANGASNVPLRPAFVWTVSPLAADYLLEVDDTSDFSSPVYTATVASSTHTPGTDLPSNTHLYWRVTANNPCGAGAHSSVFSFTTVAAPGDCATGSLPVVLYGYGFEAGAGGWTHSGTGDSWAIAVTNPHSGTSQYHASDPTIVSDQRLVSPAVVLPTGENPVVLKFWHVPNLEPSGAAACFDGGILEVSTDGGTTWTQVPNANLLVGPYRGTVSSSFANPLAGLQAWCGTTSYIQTIADVSAYAGLTAQFRLRLGSDNSVSNPGWDIDDVLVQSCTPVDPTIFVDGFESGTTSAWSLAVP